MSYDRELTPRESEIFLILEQLNARPLPRVTLRDLTRRLVAALDRKDR